MRVGIPSGGLVKIDIPPPPTRVPRKRRQLERLLDVHLAILLDGDEITDAERDRLLAVKALRRKPREGRDVGLLVGQEGVTPQQLATVTDVLRELSPTAIHHPRLSKALYAFCKSLDVPLHKHRTLQDVMRNSQYIIAAPRQTVEPIRKTGVWEIVRKAKNRQIDVTVILPDGTNIGRGGG